MGRWVNAMVENSLPSTSNLTTLAAVNILNTALGFP